jgi:cellulose synthase operon protein C
MTRLRTLLVGALAATLAGTPVASAQPAPAAPPAPPPPSPQVLDDFEQDFVRYEEAANQHHVRMRSLLLREYDKRKQELEARYAEKLRGARDEKNRRQLEAIALLEKFIREHPDHPQFTPDAMFRLADLYLDKAEEEFKVAFDTGEAAVADYSRSTGLWERILTDFPDYRQRPSTLYLLAYYGPIDPNWAGGQRRALLLYLSLVCANNWSHDMEPPEALTRDQIRARIDVRELTDPYQGCESLEGAEVELVRHAWVRGIGDYHFQEVELDEAIAAYDKVAEAEDSPLYAETTYKLAWSYYRRDFLKEAIALFDRSVALYDATLAQGERPKLELRKEALEYIAISFTDPWDGEGQTNPDRAFERVEAFYQGREGEPHVRDVWVQMGHAFRELGAYDHAANAYYKAIKDPWRLHPENPEVHMEIVDVYRTVDEDDPRAYQAAEEIGTWYAPGSEWAQANASNRRAMLAQRGLARRMLLRAALGIMNRSIDQQEAAGELAEADPARVALLEDAGAGYARAIGLFKEFINQYPDSKDVYEASFFLGQSQSLHGDLVARTDFAAAVADYAGAINNFRFVIENRKHAPEHFEDAAKGMVGAYERWVSAEQAAGRLPPIEVYDRDELIAKGNAQPVDLPQLYREQQQAWDWYMTLVSEPQMASAMGLNAARLSYAFLHLDDAAERYEKVLRRFCGKGNAETVTNVVEAKDTLLNIYEVRGQDQAFTGVNKYFIDNACGDENAIAAAVQQNRNLEFNRSTSMLEEATGDPVKLVEAAEKLYHYARSQPPDDPNVPTALYNSAIAYRDAGRPKTALHLLEEFLANKGETYRKSPYYTQAYLLKAAAYQDMYDYDKAAEAYLELREQARNHKRNDLALPPGTQGDPAPVFQQMALNTLYNAARMRELGRSFSAAVKLYRDYEKEVGQPEDKSEAAWRVAQIYKAQGDVGNMATAYDVWRKRYGNTDDTRFVQSYFDIAQLYQQKKRTRDAERWGRQTIDAWKARGSTPHAGGLAAETGARMAGEWQLYFAEQYLQQTFIPYSAHERQQRQAAQLEAVQEKLTQTRNEAMSRYTALVSQYKYPVHMLAALARLGEIYLMYGTKWRAIPAPKVIQDYVDKYGDPQPLLDYENALTDYVNNEGCPRQTTDGQLIPRGCPAAAREVWDQVLSIARTNQVSNRWVRLTREKLASEFPDEYEYQHQEIVEGTEEP